MPGPQFTPKPFVRSSASWHCPEPSASMDERVLDAFNPDDALLQFAHEALRAIRISARGCTDACRALHADLSQSEGGRHVAASEIAHKLAKAPLGLVDKSNERFSQEISRLKSKIAAPPVDSTIRGTQLATELRIFLRDQTSADRRKEITRSLESGDDQTMSAILSAPAMLSGLSQNEVDNFRLVWQRKRFPKELARIAQLEKAAGAVSLGGQLLLNHQIKMSAPAIVQEAKKFRDASVAAIAQASGAH
jgi:hypothetical protein